MTTKAYCLFCGRKPYAKTELLPFPRDEELVNKWLKKLNVNSTNLNLRSAKICLTHYNRATAEDSHKLLAVSDHTKHKKSVNMKNVCIICTLLSNKITQFAPFDLIPFPRDELTKKAWSKAFGLDLTKVNHNSASICLEHWSTIEQDTNKIVQEYSTGSCLACQFAKLFTSNSNDNLIPFPKDENLRFTWATKLNIPPNLVNKRASICIDHYKNVQSHHVSTNKQTAVDRYTCLVCRYSSEIEKAVDKSTLIPFPMNEELRNQWARIFKLPIEFINNKSARICVDHYKQAEKILNGQLLNYSINTFNEVSFGNDNARKYSSKYTTFKFICLVCGFRPEDPSVLMPFPFTKNDQLCQIWAMKFALPVEVINQRNARFCVEHFADDNELSQLEPESESEPFEMTYSINEEILPEPELIVKIEPEEFSTGNVCIKSEPSFEPESIVEIVPKFEITEIKQEINDNNFEGIFIKTEKQMDE